MRFRAGIFALATCVAFFVSAGNVSAGSKYRIPRLANGPHMGIIIGFDDLSGGPYDRVARANSLLDDAAEAGATISRIQVDWGDLDNQGVYSETDLLTTLAAARSRGQDVFVTLSTLDSDGFTVPADLQGRSLADEILLRRFEQFLDWFVPILTAHGVWGLSLGNEVDEPVRADRSIEGAALEFFTVGRNRARQLDPDMSITVTFTIGAIQEVPAFTRAVVDLLDLATLNFYCLNFDFTVNGPERWDEGVQLMKQTAGELPIMIQELGCPVGYGDGGVGATQGDNDSGGSPARQVEFFEYFQNVFENDPQFRAATVFQLYDWSPELADLFGDLIRDPANPAMDVIADRFAEWLASSGLCRWADGTCRPAWDTWLGSLQQLEVQRAESTGTVQVPIPGIWVLFGGAVILGLRQSKSLN